MTARQSSQPRESIYTYSLACCPSCFVALDLRKQCGARSIQKQPDYKYDKTVKRLVGAGLDPPIQLLSNCRHWTLDSVMMISRSQLLRKVISSCDGGVVQFLITIHSTSNQFHILTHHFWPSS